MNRGCSHENGIGKGGTATEDYFDVEALILLGRYSDNTEFDVKCTGIYGSWK